ncbi:putative transcription regulator Rcd1-like family [Helianthus annuus]|nr:putative transcription regulator Rcd1-like family [Helianthus annuus]KAJ0892047.1 putative transcription regulator Rcd1-like family [Helianthus annuus]
MAYKLLSPAALSMKEATRVCNALALMQVVSISSTSNQCQNVDTNNRLKFIHFTAKLPVYIYPFLNTTEKAAKHFDYLRLTSLGVIGALVKHLENFDFALTQVEDANTPEIIHFLLDTEVLPLCLRCIEVGSDLAKTVYTNLN